MASLNAPRGRRVCLGVACFLWIARDVTCWSPNSPVTLVGLSHKRRNLLSSRPQLRKTATFPASATFLQQHVNAVEAVASSGLDDEELSVIMDAVCLACQEEGLSCGRNELVSIPDPCVPSSVPSATGRVILLRTLLLEESIQELHQAVAQQLDQLLYSTTPSLEQPVLISIRKEVGQISPENCVDSLCAIVAEEVRENDLVVPLPRKEPPSDVSYIPELHVEIDGANITDYRDSITSWDTSTLLVFDSLVSDDLRRRLLDIVLGNTNTHQTTWDDTTNGPDPCRWVRGSLLDTPQMDDDIVDGGPCWGLTDDAIADICYQHHDAIEEFENILSALFPDFIVTRLPEAVFGSSVSPLTANAPTNGDVFNYHIDGDPNLAPPSPWTDVYGRYPNRLRGKPRFISCLIYLNDEWDGQAWGAPTRFLDVPTNHFYDVTPSPGRCVFMDQDISHTVVPPTAAAKKRPRYSLVWKLVLHPRLHKQDMSILMGNSKSPWPDTLSFGSAQRH